jgi:hypothetical protein
MWPSQFGQLPYGPNFKPALAPALFYLLLAQCGVRVDSCGSTGLPIRPIVGDEPLNFLGRIVAENAELLCKNKL